MFRDDHDALLARLAALDAAAATHGDALAARDAAIAARDRRIAELEAEVRDLRADVLDLEASVVEAQRRRRVDSPPVTSTSPPIGSLEAGHEADRLLAEGLERYRKGDKAGATACFERGLSLVPDHAQLVRALRRYT